MQYLVNRQIAVEADTAEQALEKTKPNEGETISLGAQPRPTPPQIVTSGQFSRTSGSGQAQPKLNG